MDSGHLDATPERSATRARSGADELSLFEVAALFFTRKGRLIRWAAAGAVIAVLPLLFKSRTWTANASFVPEMQAAEDGQAGLRRLAGQFGFAIPGSGSRNSPEYFAELVQSRAILGRLVEDTVVVAEEGGARRVIMDLFNVPQGSMTWRQDETMRILRERTNLTVTDAGILRYSATTKWPSVSEWIVRRVVEELDRYNVQASQQRATEERRFVEARLQAQRQLVAAAEDRLAAFLQNNRQFQNSPDLTFLHDRLHRDVSLQQQVLVNLAQANEEARIREVRDVRTTTIIDPPRRPTTPDRRGRLKRALLGLIAGMFIGAALVLISELMSRRSAAGDPGAQRLSFMMQQFGRRLRPLRFRRS